LQCTTAASLTTRSRRGLPRRAWPDRHRAPNGLKPAGFPDSSPQRTQGSLSAATKRGRAMQPGRQAAEGTEEREGTESPAECGARKQLGVPRRSANLVVQRPERKKALGSKIRSPSFSPSVPVSSVLSVVSSGFRPPKANRSVL
jgi:hypothetical protein